MEGDVMSEETKITAREAAQSLRAIPSEARAQASRENGKKGGRPRVNVELLKKWLPEDIGIGSYAATASYKLANGDLTREQLSEHMGWKLGTIPKNWTWDDHDALIKEGRATR
jgi:hypothetical protein